MIMNDLRYALIFSLMKVRKDALRKMPYNEYLQTKEWQHKRKKALALASNRCQACGTSGVELHVHHKTYERRGEELPGDLMVLCKYCHANIHDLAESADTNQDPDSYRKSWLGKDKK